MFHGYTKNDRWTLVICCLISVVLLLVGIKLNSHSPTVSSWLVNISASLVIVAVTIGIIEHIRSKQLSRELRPSRIQALTDISMELGMVAMRVYDLIDKSYTDPLLAKQQSKSQKPDEPLIEKYHRITLDVLAELNGGTSRDFLAKSKISERKYVDVTNRLDDLKQSIESIRRKYDYGLDSHLNDEFLRLANTIKPATTLYSLSVILSPSPSKEIDTKGVDALSSVIGNLVSARSKIEQLYSKENGDS